MRSCGAGPSIGRSPVSRPRSVETRNSPTLCHDDPGSPSIGQAPATSWLSFTPAIDAYARPATRARRVFLCPLCASRRPVYPEPRPRLPPDGSRAVYGRPAPVLRLGLQGVFHEGSPTDPFARCRSSAASARRASRLAGAMGSCPSGSSTALYVLRPARCLTPRLYLERVLPITCLLCARDRKPPRTIFDPCRFSE